jgi:hypothetical protein
MPKYNSDELIRQYGLQKGLELLNALVARDMGIMDEHQLRRYMHQNLSLFLGKPLAYS